MTAPPSTRSTGRRRWRLVRADPDAVPYSVRRFTERARRRRMRAAGPGALIGAVAALAALAGWGVYGTSLLGVGEVRVTGVGVLTADQVREAAGVRDGTPLARVDLSAVRGRVARLAPVERVTVSRDWPHAIVVAVTERTAVAVVPQEKKFLLVDGAGVIFDTATARPGGLPSVEVKSPADAAAGVQALAVLTPQLRAALVSIRVDGPASIRLELTGGREVIWGDATRGEDKAKVATALLGHGESFTVGGSGGGRGKVLDVSALDVVTIR